MGPMSLHRSLFGIRALRAVSMYTRATIWLGKVRSFVEVPTTIAVNGIFSAENDKKKSTSKVSAQVAVTINGGILRRNAPKIKIAFYISAVGVK